MDLESKSKGRFLHDRDLRHERVKNTIYKIWTQIQDAGMDKGGFSWLESKLMTRLWVLDLETFLCFRNSGRHSVILFQILTMWHLIVLAVALHFMDTPLFVERQFSFQTIQNYSVQQRTREWGTEIGVYAMLKFTYLIMLIRYLLGNSSISYH